MLQVTTQKNTLRKNAEGNKFCFRSYITETLTTEQMVQEIMNYNSTITEPDARGVIDILGIMVKRFAARGYNVELPFGSIHTTALGSCEKLENAFQPGTGNNRIAVVAEMNDDAGKEIIEQAVFRQMEPGMLSDPKITSICAVLDNSTESSELKCAAGSMIRIRGRNFSPDVSDSEQGVFLVNDTVSYRISRYSRSGTCVIDAFIPSGVPAGSYKVRVNTKPYLNRYKDDTGTDPVEITA
jgi:hypothetical protein